MYKTIVSLILLLMVSLPMGGFLTGCQGHSASSPATETSEQTPRPTFHDPPLRMVGGEEEKGLCSWLIDLVLDGLKEGVTVNIADNTTGRLLDYIENDSGDPEAAAAFDAIYSQLTQIQAQLSNVENQINSLIGIIALDQDILTNQINGIDLSGYSDPITNAFNTDPTGKGNGNSNGYMYLAATASNLDTSNTAAVNQLKNQVSAFYSNNSVTTLTSANNGIYRMICPPPTLLTEPIFKSYARFIAQSANTGQSDAAMQSYKLLEQLFSQILTYQLQAMIMISELDNYNDPSGDTAQIDLKSFQNMLVDEAAQFQAAVNYLMINLVDYRSSANFNNESGYMHTSGLAPDDVYTMVFARSRFFTAQLLNSFQKDAGLHGAIVTPLYNSPGPNTTPAAVVPVTIKFSGYTTTSKGRSFTGYSSVTRTVSPTKIAGRYPYTKWDITGTNQTSSKSSVDNHWAFYEFSADHNLPAGRYAVTLVDAGDQNAPWYHTETDLGTISVLYYDPKNPKSAGTPAPTPANTFKFGSGSARWNWGFNRMSLSPTAAWTVPAKVQNYYYTYLEDQGADSMLVNPSILKNLPKGSYSYFPNYAQESSSTDPLTTFSIGMTPIKTYYPEFIYALQFPFIIDNTALPGGAVPSTTPVATIYYNNSATVVSKNMFVNFDYNLLDSVKKTTVNIATYSYNNNGNVDKTVVSQDVFSKPITLNNAYDMVIQAGLFDYWSYNKGSGNVTMKWDMQVIYTNTLPLP